MTEETPGIEATKDIVAEVTKLQEKIDRNYCGLSPLVTGKEDPYWKAACISHDEAFDKLLTGHSDKTGLEVTGRFLRDSTSVFLKSIWGVAAYPAYLLLGGLGGFLRWAYLSATLPKTKG